MFGLGLIVSGMSNPAKVVAFVDLAGAWDPSLVLVMVGAIAVAALAFAVARKRTVSFIGAEMRLPTARHIDRRLMLGGLLFGIGWGLAGFCPAWRRSAWARSRPSRSWPRCWSAWARSSCSKRS